MATLGDIVHHPDQWWGFSRQHGWVVKDESYPVRKNSSCIVLLRSRDWTELREPVGAWGAPFYEFCIMHLSHLEEGPEREEAEQGLLAAYQEYQSKKEELFRLARGRIAQEEERARLQRRDAIRTYCATRGIDTLVHFTRLENLAGILVDGILPRSTLERQARRIIFNDDIRTDGHKDAVCLSIGFPNYKMFYKYRCADQAATWAVLLIRADVLWELDCAFCWANAACSAIRRVPLASRKEPSSLERMFADQCEVSGISRAACGIPDCYPTNPQAEVLAFSRVPLDYLAVACFKDQASRSRCPTPNGIRITVDVKPEYFSPRSDWQVWE